ncbi:hypothetical protein CROQUDRAFT_50815 [Cronartium quercuum f. sp. fusiforme G11]|uniref:Uncharacterized protein n=1 Tax=Cronartium quercuum f. sp. fusiforme G11 TaxID=708437 RepID=A0A9P6N8U5_9BASI|nr:hypothetical protein CROQUDRAFT_50815 [Cronartium quercuum f. sp. fusiforme G11]
MEPLPLRFALLPTYTFRLDAPLVPVLYVRFPGEVSSSLPHAPPASSSPPSLNTSFIDVVRILDPEHRSPFIALGRLLALVQPVSISPLAALDVLRELPKASGNLKPVYSLLLNGLAPFPDLWITLPLARDIAKRYGLLQSDDSGLLAHLLDWQTRAVWSVVTLSSARTSVRTGELVSNWRVPEDVLILRDYSISSLSESVHGYIIQVFAGLKPGWRNLRPRSSSLPRA